VHAIFTTRQGIVPALYELFDAPCPKVVPAPSDTRSLK
jgi:hypothetical protein